MENNRENVIAGYFAAWLSKDASALDHIFTADTVYSESYGPEYHGLAQIKSWFADWVQHGSVLQWNIKQFIHSGDVTVVEWYFKCLYDGKTEGFDGVSLIVFDRDGRIRSLKEFKSEANHYMPYAQTTI